MEKLGVAISLTYGYHPQSNDHVEHANQEVGRFLRAYCYNNQEDWAKVCPELPVTLSNKTHSFPVSVGLSATAGTLEH